MEVPEYHELDRSGITDDHRLAIAHCVMEWAKCESLLRALLTAIEGRPLDEGARDYRALSPEDAWKRIKRALRSKGATDQVLLAIQNNRSASRDFYEARKLVVHAGCIGVWSKDPSYLMFAPFESEQSNEMSIHWMPIDELFRSATFARSAAKLAHKIMSGLGY